MFTPKEKIRLVQFLEDDRYQKDVTSAITPSTHTKAMIRANEPCLLAGVEEAEFLFKQVGLRVKKLKNDGQWIGGGNVLSIQGNNRDILRVERTALNVLSRSSGVASACRKAQEIAGARTKIALTRKTVPGFGWFDKKAAEIAGIWPHRQDLFEAVLIKENHLMFFDNPIQAIKTARKTGKFLEIEVESYRQALEAAKGKPDMILLDNFSQINAKKTIETVHRIDPGIKIELSGGINFKNLAQYAALKPDFISMGELTRNATGIDFSLDMVK